MEGHRIPCTCIVCTYSTICYSRQVQYNTPHYSCPICDKVLCNVKRYRKHFKTHFEEDDGTYACSHGKCKETLKHWRDFKRHSKAHCIRPELFDCGAPGCDRKGVNGFPRKDKMRDHWRKIHARTVYHPAGVNITKLAPKSTTPEQNGMNHG